MGSSILSEVDDTSILRTGLSTCYWRPLGRLPASRLRPPRSGLERSDFVLWPLSSVALTQQIGSDRSNSGHAVNVAATQMTSRPEEFHLRALPEPCMTL